VLEGIEGTGTGFDVGEFVEMELHGPLLLTEPDSSIQVGRPLEHRAY
jgi:hypothetical protein